MAVGMFCHNREAAGHHAGRFRSSPFD